MTTKYVLRPSTYRAAQLNTPADVEKLSALFSMRTNAKFLTHTGGGVDDGLVLVIVFPDETALTIKRGEWLVASPDGTYEPLTDRQFEEKFVQYPQVGTVPA